MSVTIESITAKVIARTRDSGLTPREFEILELVCKGYVSKQIGPILGISKSTADQHRVNIAKKLGAGNQCQMVYIAVKRGLV